MDAKVWNVEPPLSSLEGWTLKKENHSQSASNATRNVMKIAPPVSIAPLPAPDVPISMCSLLVAGLRRTLETRRCR